MSEYRTPEEDTIGGHHELDEDREDGDLEPEGGEKPEGAPAKREGQTTEHG